MTKVIFKIESEDLEEERSFDDDWTQQDIHNEFIDWLMEQTEAGWSYVD